MASRRPEALPDGLAAELVCLEWEEDGELLVRPGLLHLQRSLPVSRTSISSLGPGPEGRAEAAPPLSLGFFLSSDRASVRQKPVEAAFPRNEVPPPQVLGTGRVGGWPGRSPQGARPPGASQTHLESLREVQGAAELVRSRCYFLRGERRRGCSFQLSTSHLRAVPPAREFVPTSRMGRFCQTAWKPARLGVGSPVHSKLSHYTRLFS